MRKFIELSAAHQEAGTSTCDSRGRPFHPRNTFAHFAQSGNTRYDGRIVDTIGRKGKDGFRAGGGLNTFGWRASNRNGAACAYGKSGQGNPVIPILASQLPTYLYLYTQDPARRNPRIQETPRTPPRSGRFLFRRAEVEVSLNGFRAFL